MLVFEDKYVITGSNDGGVRLWTVNEREQTLQFYVQNQVRTRIVIHSYVNRLTGELPVVVKCLYVVSFLRNDSRTATAWIISVMLEVNCA